jgi:alanine racemase
VRSTVIRISLSQLKKNLQFIQKNIGKSSVCAVVKADAYGHGLVPIAQFLANLGVHNFGVALLEEGIALREAGIRHPILVWGESLGQDPELIRRYNLIPVIGQLEQLSFLERLRVSPPLPIHIEIDTGMSRLGSSVADYWQLLRAVEQSPYVCCKGVMSHFASADKPECASNIEQKQTIQNLFRETRAQFPSLTCFHTSNSAALLNFADMHWDMVRCGLLLYGYHPDKQQHAQRCQSEFSPLVTWEAEILHIRKVPAHTGIGYGSRFITKRPSTIATIGVGYADGYPYRWSSRAQVLLHGNRAPIVGDICMDVCMIDVTSIPSAQVGDMVTLLGKDKLTGDIIDAYELAMGSETLVYEILCHLGGRRVPRYYIEDANILP